MLPTNQDIRIVRRKKQNKHEIPKEFWDECNVIERMLYNMDERNMSKVFKHLYTFQDKYVHLWDNKTYNEKMTGYIVKYNSKALLLTNKTK